MQITVISGKGGTGKTTVTASLATLFKDLVVVDCDVDASNLHLLLKPSVKETKPYFGHKFYEVDECVCVGCGACETYCRFGAVRLDSHATIDPIVCESCGVCLEVCPVGAISMKERPCGEVYISDTEFGAMVHARLDPGMGTAGKLVTMVREEAAKIAGKDGLVLIDGPPGIGCPMIASVSGADIVLIVVEPTISGHADFMRALAVVRRFNVLPCVCINKYDLNEAYTRAIEGVCAESGVPVVGKIPYDRAIFDCVCRGEIPARCAGSGIKDRYVQLYENLKDIIEKKRS
jgi:MinD superfamily P-loop ATPase